MLNANVSNDCNANTNDSVNANANSSANSNDNDSVSSKRKVRTNANAIGSGSLCGLKNNVLEQASKTNKRKKVQRCETKGKKEDPCFRLNLKRLLFS